MMPRYVEAPPCPALAPWVLCHWSIRGPATAPLLHRVLPDGCADVMVDLAAEPYAFAVGAMHRAIVVELTGGVDLFGVRFRPGAALPFLGLPLHEISDLRIPLDALWGGVAASLADALASAHPAERVARAERILCRRPRDPRRDDGIVSRAVAMLDRSGGRAALRDLTGALNVGERWLERAFDRYVGLSPKGFARVTRFRHALRRIDHGTPSSWTSIAFASGYADQPHFIREFKALAGVTPVAYAGERRRVGFLQDGDPGEA